MLHNSAAAPIFKLKERNSPVKKDHMTKRQFAGYARTEHDLEIAHRARITASLREQRLKRDAEIAAAGLPVKPPKTAAKQKAS